MFENIVSNIICSQFDRTFGQSSDGAQRSNPNHGMQVTFSLRPDYGKEEGYRHLTILIFGGGYNYIGVYGKLDWNVTNNEGEDYVKGETPWVLLGYHDSCWRDAVSSVLQMYRERISTIDYLFNGKTGWYKDVLLSEEQIESLAVLRSTTPGYGNAQGHRVRLNELDFKFEEVSK